MGIFTDVEVAYLNKGLLGHLATVGADGRPHVVPLGVWYDPQAEALVIGGYAGTNMAASKKFRDAQRHPDVAVVINDADSFLEIRGHAETFTQGGEEIGKRLGAGMPFDPAWILIHPRRIVAMGINPGTDAEELTARDVAPQIKRPSEGQAMTASTQTTRSVHVHRIYIQAAPTTVWEAITSAEWTERHLYVRGEFDLRPGGTYRGLASGNVTPEERWHGPDDTTAVPIPSVVADGQVIEVDPPRKLVHTWRVLLDERLAAEGFSRLSWELQEHPIPNRPTTITKLLLTHDATGAPQTAAFASDPYDGGLMGMLSNLKTALETGQTPIAPQERT